MRIKLLIMTLAFSLFAIAQGKSELDVFQHHAIDSVQLIVSYSLSFKHDRSGKEKPEIHKVYTYCGHNQSLRIKGNRGKRKECNYLK